ncbi:hypothetical protein [uncultured Roseovarius sp.]|uniref:hypothetical protein n=1 Tax=uncultured Roseovarius sp. TaxID=293344 RepID=UPI00262ACE45|nr:hypothetical protein [uncultured Roseovarius sp.]
MSFDFNASDYKIFGDSNVYTIARAVVRSRGELKASGFPLSLVRPLASANEFYSPFYSVVEGQMVITDPKIRERLTGSVCDSEGRVFKPNGSVWFFSGGFHTLTFLNSKRWDTHRHWRVTHKPILPPVSDAVFAAMVLDINGEFLNFLSDATSLGHSVAVLSSPPPTERFVTRMWSAPIEWSDMNVSAWSVFGLSGRCFWALVDGIPERCAA